MLQGRETSGKNRLEFLAENLEMQPWGRGKGDTWDILERFCPFPTQIQLLSLSKPHLGKQRK